MRSCIEHGCGEEVGGEREPPTQCLRLRDSPSNFSGHVNVYALWRFRPLSLSRNQQLTSPACSPNFNIRPLVDFLRTGLNGPLDFESEDLGSDFFRNLTDI